MTRSSWLAQVIDQRDMRIGWQHKLPPAQICSQHYRSLSFCLGGVALDRSKFNETREWVAEYINMHREHPSKRFVSLNHGMLYAPLGLDPHGFGFLRCISCVIQEKLQGKVSDPCCRYDYELDSSFRGWLSGKAFWIISCTSAGDFCCLCSYSPHSSRKLWNHPCTRKLTFLNWPIHFCCI